MSRPARCMRRSLGLPPKGLRKAHRYTSWTSYSGWICGQCGRKDPNGNRAAPEIVAGGDYLRCEECVAYHGPGQHLERIQ